MPIISSNGIFTQYHRTPEEQNMIDLQNQVKILSKRIQQLEQSNESTDDEEKNE